MRRCVLVVSSIKIASCPCLFSALKLYYNVSLFSCGKNELNQIQNSPKRLDD